MRRILVAESRVKRSESKKRKKRKEYETLLPGQNWWVKTHVQTTEVGEGQMKANDASSTKWFKKERFSHCINHPIAVDRQQYIFTLLSSQNILPYAKTRTDLTRKMFFFCCCCRCFCYSRQHYRKNTLHCSVRTYDFINKRTTIHCI